MTTTVDISTLKSQIAEVQRRVPALSPDNAFVFWFLRACLVEDDNAVKSAIVGGPRDKGVDAVFFDHPNKKVFLVQGKYRTTPKPRLEKHADVIAFADLARVLFGSRAELQNLLVDGDAVVQQRLTTAYDYIHRRGYALHLYFLTTGTVSSNLEEEAQGNVESASSISELTFLNRSKVLRLVRHYIDTDAQAVTYLDLPIENGGGARGGGIIKRYDPRTGIESWVFSMLGSDLGALYAKVDVRLFARNIRGFLGKNTDVNRAIRSTLTRMPENFWYFNNGVTVVCDEARKREQHGSEVLRAFAPQIINGQQTTRMLKGFGSKRASVLVRVIAIPHEGDDGATGFETLVSSIVAATNYQNAIFPSDLRSNDGEQVRIERELRRLNYQYLRKRQAKSETRIVFDTAKRLQIKKEHLAKAVAACEFDPVEVRQGKERLFEDEFYPRIFCGRPAKEYLTHYWLDRIVKWTAKGKPQRAYARWLVLNFVWKKARGIISAGTSRDKFLFLNEHRNEEGRLDSLYNFADHTFSAASAFFNKNRGRGEESLDPSTFFKRRGLDDQFEKFWNSASNRSRTRAIRALKRFEKRLLGTELE